MSGENRFQGPGAQRPMSERRRDAYPQTTDGEPGDVPPAPAGFDELEFPDEITLDLASGDTGAWNWWRVQNAMFNAGLAVDEIQVSTRVGPGTLAAFDGPVSWVVTRQAADTYYAGVPRGRRLVLRRI